MTEWQPIETAPKDGRTFLAYGAWPMFPSAPDICFCHWDEDDEWWAFEGEEMLITHWMDLPAPPVNTSAERVLKKKKKQEKANMSDDLILAVGELTLPQWQDWLLRYNSVLIDRESRIEKLEAALRAVIRYAGNAGDDYLADQASKALEEK